MYNIIFHKIIDDLVIVISDLAEHGSFLQYIKDRRNSLMDELVNKN